MEDERDKWQDPLKISIVRLLIAIAFWLFVIYIAPIYLMVLFW